MASILATDVDYDGSATAKHAAVITPSDSADLTYVTRRIHLGVGGDLKVTMAGGETVVLPALVAGNHDLAVTRVWSTLTTATNISASW